MRLPVLLSGEVLLAALLLCPQMVRGEGTKPVSGTATSRRPNLLLITAEGLRPDRLGCYREKDAIPTPSIDSLAANSLLFEHVLAPSPSSLPSLATLMTGTYPFKHRVWDDDYRNLLGGEIPTLAERLRGSGYRTGAFVGTSLLAASRGFSRGFESYDDGYRPGPTGAWRLVRRPGGSLVPVAKGWLDSVDRSPFFLWVHFIEPSVLGVVTVEQPTRDASATYSRAIGELDARVGETLQLLRDRGLYDETLVVLAADHGLGLGDHDEFRSGVFLYETTVRVPLLIKGISTHSREGKRVESLSGLIDVYPTLEHLLGLKGTPGLQGRDLLSPIPSAHPAYHATALMGREVFGWAPLELVAEGSLRLVMGSGTELYDVDSDPFQDKDLKGSRRADASRLERIRRGINVGAFPPPHFRPAATISADFIRRLVKMGYSTADETAIQSQHLSDPREHAKILPLLEAVRLEVEVAGFGALQKAENSLLEADPTVPFTLLNAAQLNITRGLKDRKALDRAAEQLKSLQNLFPKDPETYHILGHLAISQGRPEDAEAFLKISRILGPLYPGEVTYDLACAYARQGKSQEALSELRRGISLGFRDRDHISTDPDLESLRANPAYLRLMREEFPSPSGG